MRGGYTGGRPRAQQSPGTGGKRETRGEEPSLGSEVRSQERPPCRAPFSGQPAASAASGAKPGGLRAAGEGKSEEQESKWETTTSQQHLHFLCEAEEDHLLLSLQETVETVVKQSVLQKRREL